MSDKPTTAELITMLREFDCHADVQKLAADRLEEAAALPKWTRITDDMSKLPNEFIAYFEDGKVDMYQLKPGHRLDYSLIHAGMTHWRPLCDLDYPPEDIK